MNTHLTSRPCADMGPKEEKRKKHVSLKRTPGKTMFSGDGQVRIRRRKEDICYP